MKKILSVLLASVMVLALLAGCSNQADKTSTAPENNTPAGTEQSNPPEGGKQYDGVNLTMWSMWNSDEPQGKVIQEAVAAFEEQTGAKITVEWKGRDVNTILSASLESGEKFDIFEDDYQRIANIYKDFTYDLTDMAAVAGYASHSYACFNDTVIDWTTERDEDGNVTKEGFLNSIAEQPQVGGIFYDKDAFEKAGIAAEPKTWAEFLDVCQKLKDAGIAPIAQDSAYADFAFYHHLVRHLGEEKITELDTNGGWADEAGAVTAAQEIIDLVNAGYLAEGAPDEYPSSQNKIGFGQAAMVVCANYVTAEVNNATGTEVNWGLFNYPAVDGGVDNGSAYIGTNSLAITSYTENAQAAFDFIMFLTSGEMDQKMADTAAQIPADSRNTAPANLTGTIETLLSADSPMTWCNGFNARDDLKTAIKSTIVELFEGKFATGEDFCKALDALY